MPIARTTPLLLIALCGSPVLAAQPTQQPDQAQGERDAEQIERTGPATLTLRASAGVTYQADADFDGNIGELSLLEYRAGLTALINFEDAGRLSINLSAGLLDYDVSPSPTSVAGDAASIGAELDTIHTLGLTGIYSDRFNDTTNWFIGAGVGFTGEEDADFGDGFDWLFTGGFEYKQSDTLTWGIGVLVKSQLEDDVLIVPVPRITWKIDDRWTLASERAGLRLSYKSSDELSYGISGEYRSDSFRLDDTHAAAVEGMGTHRRIPIGLFAEYTPNDRIVIDASVGAALGGELEFLDTNGNDVSKQDLDPGFYGSLNLSFKF
jgi:opacity protein-like surface antigen